MYVQAYISTLFLNISIMTNVEFQEHENEKIKSGMQEMSFFLISILLAVEVYN